MVEALNTLGDEYLASPEGDGVAWVVNQHGKEALMKVKDGDGRPLLTMLAGQNFLDFRVMGLPVVILPALTGVGSGGDPTDIYLGAWKLGFYIGDRGNADLFVSADRFADENVTYFRFTMGHDSRAADANAVVDMQDVQKP